PVAVVAGLLPDERPLSARGDDAGNVRDHIVPDGLRRSATRASTSARPAAAASRGRRFARRDQRRVAGIERSLYRRRSRIDGRGRQPRRRMGLLLVACGLQAAGRLGDEEYREDSDLHDGTATRGQNLRLAMAAPCASEASLAQTTSGSTPPDPT